MERSNSTEPTKKKTLMTNKEYLEKITEVRKKHAKNEPQEKKEEPTKLGVPVEIAPVFAIPPAVQSDGTTRADKIAIPDS